MKEFMIWAMMRANSKLILSFKLKTGTWMTLLTPELKTMKFLDKSWSQNTKFHLSKNLELELDLLRKRTMKVRKISNLLPLRIKLQLVETSNNSKLLKEVLMLKSTWAHSPKPSNNTTVMKLPTLFNWTRTQDGLMFSTQQTMPLITKSSLKITLLPGTTNQRKLTLTNSSKISANGRNKLTKLLRELNKLNKTIDSENLTTKSRLISVWKSTTSKDLRCNSTEPMKDSTFECSKDEMIIL